MLLFKTIPSTTYTTCAKTPMQVFIDVQVTKDLSHLIISGEHTTEALMLIWENLIAEYQTLTKDTQTSYLFELRKSIEVMDKRLVILRLMLDQLEIKDIPEISALILEEYGFEGTPDAIWSRAKRDLHQLKIKEAELAKLTAPDKAQPDFDYFDQLGILSEYQGFKFNTKTDTVAEYISLLNRFKKDNQPKNGR
jgi:hypothetical protein